MKRNMILIAGIVILIMALSSTTALAGSPSPANYGKYNPLGLANQPPEAWGVEKVIPISSAPGGVVRIITDPLVAVGDDQDASGWVTFWCQSNIGFQYRVGATGLEPLSEYSVHALGPQFVPTYPGDPDGFEFEGGMWIKLVGSVDLDLGTLKTDANGLGGVQGVTQLPSGTIYNLSIVVTGTNGPVLANPSDDASGFVVY